MKIVEIQLASPQIYCVDLDAGMYWPREYPHLKTPAWPKMIEIAKQKIAEGTRP